MSAKNYTRLNTATGATPASPGNEFLLMLDGESEAQAVARKNANPGSVTTSPNVPGPTGVSLRQTYDPSTKTVKFEAISPGSEQLKLVPESGATWLLAGGAGQPITTGVYYPAGPQSDQGNYTQEWTLGPRAGVSGSGVLTERVYVYLYNGSRTIRFNYLIFAGTRIVLFTPTVVSPGSGVGSGSGSGSGSGAGSASGSGSSSGSSFTPHSSPIGLTSVFTYDPSQHGGALQIRGAGLSNTTLSIVGVGQSLSLYNQDSPTPGSIPTSTPLPPGQSGNATYPMDWTLWGITPGVSVQLTFAAGGTQDTFTLAPPTTLTPAPLTNAGSGAASGGGSGTASGAGSGSGSSPGSGSGSASGGGPGSGVTNTAANIPPWDTFDYTPLTTNQNVWPGFDPRTSTYRGVTRTVGRYIELANSQIKIRIWENWGGIVGSLSTPDGPNLINQYDLGRGALYALYRGGRTSPNPNAIIDAQWAVPDGSTGVGNDPIESGNVFQQRNDILVSAFNDNMVYIKARMRNWAVQDEFTDAICEKWVYLVGRGMHVHTRISFNRTDDQTQYTAEQQEYPCFYTVVGYRRAVFKDGNGNLASKEDQFQQIPFYISKPWVAMQNVYDSSKAVGLWNAGMYRTTQCNFALEDGGDEFRDGAGYTANYPQITMDWNSKHYNHYAIIVGTVSEIQQYAEALPDPKNTLVHKFNARNGRDGFKWNNGVDTGFPTPDSGVEITRIGTAGQDVFRLYSPFVAVPANSVQKLYLRMARSGGPTAFSFVFVKVGQGEGEAEQAGQYINFDTVNDGQFRTYELNVSANGGWNNLISYYSLRGDNAMPAGAITKIAWINTQNADPEQ